MKSMARIFGVALKVRSVATKGGWIYPVPEKGFRRGLARLGGLDPTSLTYQHRVWFVWQMTKYRVLQWEDYQTKPLMVKRAIRDPWRKGPKKDFP